MRRQLLPWRHVYREQNSKADALANAGRGGQRETKRNSGNIGWLQRCIEQGHGVHIRLWFDGSCSDRQTGVGWWAEARASSVIVAKDAWVLLVAGCRPGAGTSAMSAELEVATECVSLLEQLVRPVPLE